MIWTAPSTLPFGAWIAGPDDQVAELLQGGELVCHPHRDGLPAVDYLPRGEGDVVGLEEAAHGGIGNALVEVYKLSP